MSRSCWDTLDLHFVCLLLADELLCPNISIFFKTNADMRKVFVQNVCPMAFTVHPRIDHFLRGALAFGNVFPGSRVRDAEFFHHLKWRTVRRAVVREVVVHRHIARFFAGDFAEGQVNLKRRQAVFCPLFIRQFNDLLLIGV